MESYRLGKGKLKNMEGLSNNNKPMENMAEANIQFDSAARAFLDAFSVIPYEELSEEQRALSDKIKKYFDSEHPNRTIH